MALGPGNPLNMMGPMNAVNRSPIAPRNMGIGQGSMPPDPFGYNQMSYGMSGVNQPMGQITPPQFFGPQLNMTGLNIPGAPSTQTPGLPQGPQLSRLQQRFVNRGERT